MKEEPLQRTDLTRRLFMALGSLSVASGVFASSSRSARAYPLGLPLGLQLYSVRELLAQDYEATLRRIADLGYKEVEAAGFFNRTASDVRTAMEAAHLQCVGAHYTFRELEERFDAILLFAKELGLSYIVCSFPGFRNASLAEHLSFRQQVQAFTLADFRWSATRFNIWGKKIREAGMHFSYHNHTMEFTPSDGVVPFDEMVRLTDPQFVSFELDCGWVVVGGADPVTYLQRYPTRISMLHVKDFESSTRRSSVIDPPKAAELGRGTIDFSRIFKAARSASVRHCFVEQEEFDIPPFSALTIDAAFMRDRTR